MKRIGIKVAGVLHAFIEQEALPGTGVAPDAFWAGLAGLVRDLAPRNRDLLDLRDQLQAASTSTIAPTPASRSMQAGYERFLREIGYLRPSPPIFPSAPRTSTPRSPHGRAAARRAGVATPAIALNAANARWGSLYDALYGTDAIPGRRRRRAGAASTRRAAQRVVARAAAFLDEAAPLDERQSRGRAAYAVEDGELVVGLQDGGTPG